MDNLQVATKRDYVDVKLYNIQLRPGEWMGFHLLLSREPLEMATYELVYKEDGTFELRGSQPTPFKSWEEFDREHDADNVR